MKTRLALLFGSTFLMISGFAYAGNLDTDPWQNLRTRIETDGRLYESADYATKSLERVAPNDPTQNRAADYISEVGAMVQGKFRARSVSSVSETWTLNAQNNWIIDQWLYSANLSAELTSVMHQIIEETRDHGVVSVKTVPVPGVNDAGLQTQWQTELASWLPAHP